MRTLAILSAVWTLMMAGCSDANSLNRSSSVIDPSNRFTLSDASGQSVSLDAMLKSNKAVLVNFWATWCPPCREEIPDLIELQNKYKDQGFTVLGVDVGESPAKVSSFIERSGINYPVVLDRDMRVSQEYGVVGIPTTYLINSEGQILGKYNSFTRQLVSDVEKALA